MASAKRKPKRSRDEWITLATGRPGSGKSYLVSQLIASEKGAVVAWDPTDSFGKNRWDYSGPVYPMLRRVAGGEKLSRVRCWGSRKAFLALCHYVLRRGRTLFAIDEAHAVVPFSISANHPFSELAIQVRHQLTPLILVTWRPQDLPRFVRSGTSRVWAFKTTDANAIDYLTSEAGAPANAAAKLPGLHTGPRPGPTRYLSWRL